MSVGSHANGNLIRGIAVPVDGTGYRIHPDWRSRQHAYATAEVASWLGEVFRRVNDAAPGVTVYLGDISARGGGETARHRSHASGRDVDVFYVACSDAGDPIVDLPAMLHFQDDGRASRWSVASGGKRPSVAVPQARFDARRNWEIVRQMLATETVQVQWIFMRDALAKLMLDHAERGSDPAALLARARGVLRQPSDGQPHDDHMHVRVFCASDDRARGCVDKGPKRWLKKHWKYLADPALVASASGL